MRRRERRDGRLRAQVRDLQFRVHALERLMEVASAGPPLTLETLVGSYQALRRQAVRFVELHVHPEMADQAQAVVAEGSFRALQSIVVHEDFARGAWELRPGVSDPVLSRR